jgi:hypothetical protein
MEEGKAQSKAMHKLKARHGGHSITKNFYSIHRNKQMYVQRQGTGEGKARQPEFYKKKLHSQKEHITKRGEDSTIKYSNRNTKLNNQRQGISKGKARWPEYFQKIS